jgi:hypothetical protein
MISKTKSAKIPNPKVCHVGANRVFETWFNCDHVPKAPDSVLCDVHVTPTVGKTLVIPTYWAGGNEWRFRFSSPTPGLFSFVTQCEMEPSLGNLGGTISVVERGETNPLYRHGPVEMDPVTGKFRHHDGVPFFWLADSWWFGMSQRLDWPTGFKTLTDDRASLGFSVVQFSAGLACDIEPLDPRDANEGGLPYSPGFSQINPLFYDEVDKRLEYLIERGIMPCLTGSWGYYLRFLGIEKMKRHWRYLIARYGAYPLAWNLCGESRLIYYTDGHGEAGERHRMVREQVAGWTEIANYIRSSDTYHRLLTVHPGPAVHGLEIEPLDDLSLIDFHMLQPGHSEADAVMRSVSQYGHRTERFEKPVMIGECAWEGMAGGNGPKLQRQLFWAMALSGAPGHCYGTDALWQMNSKKALFGASVLGQVWGNGTWDEAMFWPGGRHVAAAKKIIEKYNWVPMGPHPEWVSPSADPSRALLPYAAGVPGEFRIIYFPVSVPPWGSPYYLRELDSKKGYRANWIDPTNGRETPIGTVMGDAGGSWKIPHAPVLQDYLLVMVDH